MGLILYKNGDSGPKVVLIQKELKDHGFYQGNTDGIFGNITATSVKKYQASAKLPLTGIVDDVTWNGLFALPDYPVPTEISRQCLALTGSFETSKFAPQCFAAMTGNFDGQGLSFGALQWNFGQGTLQKLLTNMMSQYPDVFAKIFGMNRMILSDVVNGSVANAIAFANSIQDHTKHTIMPPWNVMFTTLGLTKEFQELEVQGAAVYFKNADNLCTDFNLLSKRAHALMFDICVQSGSIRDDVRKLMESDISKLSGSLSQDDLEIAKMRIIANRKAESSRPQYIEDIRNRKLCIANGTGTVHGIVYNLNKQFGLDMSNAN